ncbi:MAG: hypothetical protein KKD39_05185, partial [Candidatus Altiarchaeota archaeon]|nr:hypothetical protein [Candidatus Altiarchaeota archaeon]
MEEVPELGEKFETAIKEFSSQLIEHENFFVVSHHDADGITSCAITVDLLKSIGKDVEFKCIKQIDSATVDEIK